MKTLFELSKPRNFALLLTVLMGLMTAFGQAQQPDSTLAEEGRLFGLLHFEAAVSLAQSDFDGNVTLNQSLTPVFFGVGLSDFPLQPALLLGPSVQYNKATEDFELDARLALSVNFIGLRTGIAYWFYNSRDNDFRALSENNLRVLLAFRLRT